MATYLFRNQKAEVRKQKKAGFLLLSAFCLLLSVCAKREQPHYNVLLITLDTLRADHVGAYGSTRGTTPAIDALAARGVRFAEAGSTVPLTLPSHATILSGALPLHHGLRNNGLGSFPEDRPTLATLLSDRGYRTAAFVGAFVLDHRFGLNRGFSLYDDEIPRDPTLGDHLEAERRADLVVERALTWLAAKDARPFFAWVHLYDPHAPYTPPEPFRSRFAASPYDGEIAFADQQVQRLLAALEQSGEREKTIVVVTGDHGESLGEHGEQTHGLLLYEPTLRVPLVVSAPGLLDPHVVRTPVSLADVTPTLAGLMELPFAPADGRDLSASLRDRKEPAAADLYAETEYPALFGWSGLTAMRHGNYKLISSSERELYDLGRDPREDRNIFDEQRRVTRSLEDKVKALLATTNTSSGANAAPDAETMAKLASLGYVGGIPSSRPAASRPNPAKMAPLFRKFEEATWATWGKRFAEAAAILEDLVKRDPENAVFLSSLAKVERQRGRHERAIELYRESVALSPNDSQAWYTLASAFQEAGDLKRAGEAVREALRRDSRNADAHNVLGIVYSEEGQPGVALEEFQRAIAIDPRHARVYNNIGNAARALGRNDEAEAAFRKAIALAPNYPDPLNGLGALDIDRNRFVDAIASFDKALQLAPDLLEARLNRAVALQLSGDAARAMAEYRVYISRSAGIPALAERRAAARSMLAQLEAAQSR